MPDPTPETIALARRSLIARLWRAAEQQMRELEERLAKTPRQPAERLRDARHLAVLVVTFRELTALDSLHDSAARKTKSAPVDDDDTMPRNIDEFRRDLARRLERMRAGAVTDIPGAPSLASG
ncbi:MAG: hypothetical protein HY659_00450 [Rhizobiales bacterium]|nr:hypothetical protein [Hyphomicrobiales bacterium]